MPLSSHTKPTPPLAIPVKATWPRPLVVGNPRWLMGPGAGAGVSPTLVMISTATG